MIEGLLQHCKDQKDLFDCARFVMIEENEYQHADFLTLGWLLDALGRQKQVTFITFRENYAHFVSLSKKIGKSIQGYLKSKQLTYIECFESHFCSQLPLLESQPLTYVPPPSLISKMHAKDLTKHKNLFKHGQLIVIDSIGYIEQRVDLCFWLYEQAMINGCSLVLGGCSHQGDVTSIFELEAGLILKLQSDVGGYGRISVMGGGQKKSVLWRVANAKVEFSLQITI